ncbi:putative uncharacterized protein [Bacteroides thetaiotaomicron CAG:40]|nr:putative uncharacterized protein [Bacteroides thetaiotaomicron CAG:40]
MSIFQFLQSSFNWSFLISRQLITQFLQLIFCLENYAVGLVQLINLFTFFLVCFCISFSFSLHLFDFFLAQTAGSFDTDCLFFTCSLILSRYFQDTVSIDIECNLNLRNTTTSRSDT